MFFFHLPDFAEMHNAKVCPSPFITKLHLFCRHLAPFLAAIVEKLAHIDREIGSLLCFSRGDLSKVRINTLFRQSAGTKLFFFFCLSPHHFVALGDTFHFTIKNKSL